MLNICIIDDEPLALEYLESLLNKIEGVRVVGKYCDPKNLIAHIRNHKIDAVFLDIHMPSVKGIDLADELLNIQPSVHIIFVTAYNEYAVKAFELNALDYILKPLQKDRLQLTIDRIKKENKLESHSINSTSNYTIQNLGAFLIEKDGHPLEIRWRTAKTKELFAYLIQNHNQAIPKSELTNLMWTNLLWNKAHSQLYSTIYQIRKVIQNTGIPIRIISQDEFYQVKMNGVKVQSNEWKFSAIELLEGDKLSITNYFTLLEAYQGDYLEELKSKWVFEERKQIRKLWLQLIRNLIVYFNDNQDISASTVARLYALVSFDEDAVNLLKREIK